MHEFFSAKNLLERIELIAPLAIAVSKRLRLEKYKFAQGVQGAISFSAGGLGWCFGKASNTETPWWLDASERNCFIYWRCFGVSPALAPSMRVPAVQLLALLLPGVPAREGCWVLVVPTQLVLSLRDRASLAQGWLEPLWLWVCFPSVLKGVCKRLALVFTSPSCPSSSSGVLFKNKYPEKEQLLFLRRILVVLRY